MAVAVDASTPARWAAAVSSGSSTTSASFTAPANALLVACVCTDGDSSSVYGTLTVTDSGGLTWTERVRRGEGEGADGGTSVILTARTTSAVSRTVTLARSSGSGVAKRTSGLVYVLTGVDVDGTPLDSVGANNEGTEVVTNDINTTSLTPGATGLLIVCDTDWQANGVFDASSNLTQDTAHYASEISVCSGYRTCTVGVGVSGNLNAGGGGIPQHKWCQVIVRESAGLFFISTINAAIPFVGGSWRQPPNGRR